MPSITITHTTYSAGIDKRHRLREQRPPSRAVVVGHRRTFPTPSAGPAPPGPSDRSRLGLRIRSPVAAQGESIRREGDTGREGGAAEEEGCGGARARERQRRRGCRRRRSDGGEREGEEETGGGESGGGVRRRGSVRRVPTVVEHEGCVERMRREGEGREKKEKEKRKKKKKKSEKRGKREKRKLILF